MLLAGKGLGSPNSGALSTSSSENQAPKHGVQQPRAHMEAGLVVPQGQTPPPVSQTC